VVAGAGLAIVRRDATGLPVDVANRGSSDGTTAQRLGLFATVDRVATKLRPQLFGYQFVYELKPNTL